MFYWKKYIHWYWEYPKSTHDKSIMILKLMSRSVKWVKLISNYNEHLKHICFETKTVTPEKFLHRSIWIYLYGNVLFCTSKNLIQYSHYIQSSLELKLKIQDFALLSFAHLIQKMRCNLNNNHTLFLKAPLFYRCVCTMWLTHSCTPISYNLHLPSNPCLHIFLI